MNSHTQKLNSRRYIERHTKTGNQEKVSCFFASIFGILKNCQYYTVQGGLKEILSLVWQIRKLSVEGRQRKIPPVLFGSFQFSVVWELKGK